MRGAPRPCWARGVARRLSLVGFRRRRRGRRGGGLSLRALPRGLVGGLVGRLVGGLVRRFLGRFFRLLGLLARFRRVVGHVPSFTLENERRRREEAAHLSAAHVACRQRRLGNPLADFEDPSTLEALVFVGWHSLLRLHGED